MKDRIDRYSPSCHETETSDEDHDVIKNFKTATKWIFQRDSFLKDALIFSLIDRL